MTLPAGTGALADLRTPQQRPLPKRSIMSRVRTTAAAVARSPSYCAERNERYKVFQGVDNHCFRRFGRWEKFIGSKKQMPRDIIINVPAHEFPRRVAHISRRAGIRRHCRRKLIYISTISLMRMRAILR